MTKVKDLLADKGRDVWSVELTQSVFEAIELMAHHEVGALTVLNDEGRLVGIVSERDYARKVILKNRSSRETSVSDIMSRDVIYVGDDNSLEECMKLMTRMKIRHLPVMQGEALVGILSINDLVRWIIEAQSSKIEQLEQERDQ